MSLNVQLKTIILSFLYGIFIYYFFRINRNILYNSKNLIKIIGSLSIMILLSFFFFLLLLNINDGCLHINEFILMFLSYFLIAYINKR